MSFTVAVKEEILGQHHLSRHELSAIIKMSGSIGLSTSCLTLSVVTENAKLARHLYESFLHFYEIKSEIRHHQRSNLRKNRVYTVFTDEKVQNLLSDLHLADSFFGLETGIDEEILSDEEAGRAYLCGAFLANGSIRDPESGKYQLEISSVYLDHAQGIASLLQQFLLDAKVLERKKGAVTYLQRAEDIMDFLIVIGAMQARDDFERVKILRETRNDLNRANNAETANIARTVSASMKTINNISKIKDIMGLENLPVDLQEVAQLRIQILLAGKHLSSSIVQKKEAVKPSFGLFFCFVFCKLTVIEICIETSLRHQLIMISLLYDISIFHNQNKISITDG